MIIFLVTVILTQWFLFFINEIQNKSLLKLSKVLNETNDNIINKQRKLISLLLNKLDNRRN